MAKRREIKVVSYIHVGDNPPVKWEDLTPELREEYSAKMMEGVGEVVSEYYSQRPDELAGLLKNEQ